MAEIRPFPGIRYNAKKVGDLSQALCPPYDIISPAQQEALYARSPYNFVRIEYGVELPQDSPTDNKYIRARAVLDGWLAESVLITDNTPAVYVHDQFFLHQGKEFKRRALVVRLKLEEWAKMVVRPHEGTLAGPKADRIRLLWALDANTSPVLSMFEDEGHIVTSLLAEATRGKPLAASSWLDGERHELWAITNPSQLMRLRQAFTPKPVYIADGHHRYESALIYQREHQALHPQAPADAPFNFVMMTLVAFDDPGLLILPPHRLLRGLPPGKLAQLKEELPSFFEIAPVPLTGKDAWARIDKLQHEEGKLRLVLYGLDGANVWVLTLRDFEAAAHLMPAFHTDIYKRLDVSLVDHLILEELLGLRPEGEGGIAFNYDRDEAVQKVAAHEYQLVFLVKPVRPETIKAIADAQDRMPRKSTYFYPKLPSGLVVNRLV